MSKRENRASASYAGGRPTKLEDAFEDFILSRQAMMVAKRTIIFYNGTAGKFVEFLLRNGKSDPEDITSRDIREYLNTYINRGCKESYVHGHARAIRTFLRFMHQEGYVPKVVKFQMPPSGNNQHLPHLTDEELNQVLDACDKPREKALILFMVDTGVRRAELLSLNWGDVDIQSGKVHIARGKGNKSRTVVVGPKTRRALLSYRRSLDWYDEHAPLIQTEFGTRLKPMGLRSLLLRLGEKAGVHVSPHALRRTFATLCLRAGMSPLHLQGLLGHSTLEMTRRYIQMISDDLVEAHREHGPVDRFVR
jgi:integrase/recombinase XerD